MEPLTAFYRVWTDPYAGLRSQDMLDWESSRAGNKAGPFIAPHIPSLGIRLTSLGSGFPRDAPPDRIVYKLNRRRQVRDFENGSAFWIVSAQARAVLMAYAADAIDCAQAQVFVRSEQGRDLEIPNRWLCDVVRFEDVVDEANSHIAWGAPAEIRGYSVGSQLAFKKDLPADLHLFRIWKWPSVVVCSAELRSALEAANLTGIAFGRLDINEPD